MQRLEQLVSSKKQGGPQFWATNKRGVSFLQKVTESTPVGRDKSVHSGYMVLPHGRRAVVVDENDSGHWRWPKSSQEIKKAQQAVAIYRDKFSMTPNQHQSMVARKKKKGAQQQGQQHQGQQRQGQQHQGQPRQGQQHQGQPRQGQGQPQHAHNAVAPGMRPAHIGPNEYVTYPSVEVYDQCRTLPLMQACYSAILRLEKLVRQPDHEVIQDFAPYKMDQMMKMLITLEKNFDDHSGVFKNRTYPGYFPSFLAAIIADPSQTAAHTASLTVEEEEALHTLSAALSPGTAAGPLYTRNFLDFWRLLHNHLQALIVYHHKMLKQKAHKASAAAALDAASHAQSNGDLSVAHSAFKAAVLASDQHAALFTPGARKALYFHFCNKSRENVKNLQPRQFLAAFMESAHKDYGYKAFESLLAFGAAISPEFQGVIDQVKAEGQV